jgi:5-amino-6-(5-phosphoribosylamino)uracil reductase
MSDLPRIILKVAMSLDGFIDDDAPTRRIFSSAEDKVAVNELRKTVDAIFIGAETIRREDPALDAESCNPPLRVTASRSLNFDLTLKFLNPDKSGIRGIIYSSTDGTTSPKSLPAEKTELILLPSKELMLREIFADLYTCKGVRTLLVEGGSGVIRQVIENDLADELRLAIAPELLGKAGGPRFYTGDLTKRYNLREVQSLGGMSVMHLYR